MENEALQATLANSFRPANRAAWRAWLAANHGRATGVWLVLPKKASRQPGIAYEELVEEALCFGWIDGRAGTVDGEFWRIWVAPRQPRSVWAKSNKERVARLQAAGLMTPAGLAKAQAAQAAGTWALLDSVDALEMPADLEAALVAHPEARRHYQALPDSAKRGFLWWVGSAKRPQTRARRVAESVRLLAENRRLGE